MSGRHGLLTARSALPGTGVLVSKRATRTSTRLANVRSPARLLNSISASWTLRRG